VRAALWLIILLVVVRKVSAQVCAGLQPGGTTLVATGARYTYATAVGAAVTTGRRPSVTLGLGLTRDTELVASTYDVLANVSYDIRVTPRSPVFFCPAATLGLSYGPKDFLLLGGRYVYHDAALGVGAALRALSTPPLSVTAYGHVRYSRLAVRFVPDSANRAGNVPGWLHTDWYGRFDVGVGFVFGNRVVLRPGFTVPWGFNPVGNDPLGFIVPFGREDHELSPNLSIGVRLGGQTARR